MQDYKYFRQIINTWSINKDPAILYGDDKKILRYDEFAQRIIKEEKCIRDAEIHSELIVTDHEPATLVRIFACALAGCNVVLLDESTPDESLFALAKLARCDSAYSSDPELADELSKICITGVHSGGSACPHPNAAVSQDSALHSAGSVLSDAAPDPGPFASEGRFIFFTSGTTGNSRAVVLTTRSLLASCCSGQAMLPCGPGDIILSLLPLSHVFGFVCTMLWGLTYGASVALGRGTGSVLEDCRFFEPTILPAVPSLIKMLYARQCLGKNLRIALIGAAPLDYDTMKALQDEGILVYLGYGLTETSSGIAITQKQEDPFALYPCPGAKIRIENDNEISVATPCMMEGYLDLSSPYDPSYALGHPITPVPGGRLYTGDLGCFDENGAIRLIGRKKDMLILDDGTKIFCPEYEKELSDLLKITDIAVILRKNRPVVVIGDPSESPPENIEHLIDVFNEHKIRSLRISDVIHFGRPLPKTATGKIKRWEIERYCK